ncbi:hypothetical protein O181_016257 [Austropuccinia psidii MF-1]|uniref:Uncharacterized protein n=1 Tax=Austropuccinia psidii MF-1 TaxID=1389203 RepID=A0A9Q3C3N4_9BASI|nr:hypothetical protein [Austropuccinia psidii MF-1]
MEDARASTSSQMLARTFDTLIEIQEADITAIPVVRPESCPTGNNRNIQVSLQKLIFGGKSGGLGTSAKYLDKKNELISSSEGVHGPRKDRESSKGLNTHFLQSTNPTDKSLVEKTKPVVREPDAEFAPRKGQQPSCSSSSLHNQRFASTSAKKGQEYRTKHSEEQAKGKGKGKSQVEQALTTELQKF